MGLPLGRVQRAEDDVVKDVPKSEEADVELRRG